MTEWTERLSDYLDDDMSGDERTELEAALQRDAELRRVLEELREVKAAAAALPGRSPEADLWPGIESRIERVPAEPVADLSEARRARRRFSLTVPQLAAAAIALLALGSASVWIAMRSGAAGPTDRPIAVAPAPEAGFAASSEGEAFSYEATISHLETQLESGRDRLDPRTVEALERSLATIDRAIARAQEALGADPASVYLNHHLADARTRKIRILQQAALLASS